MKQLIDIYSEVLQENQDKVPVRLIDLTIKLDHMGAPPVEEILALEGELKDNYYAHNTLRDL